jgi:adenosylcobinamide-GDP ribazoletransferase
LFGIQRLPYGRPDGTGRSFFNEPVRWRDFWTLLLILGLSFLAGGRMLLANLGFAFLVIALLTYYRRKIGCITGDMLGAMIEITEAGLFFLLSAGDALR